MYAAKTGEPRCTIIVVYYDSQSAAWLVAIILGQGVHRITLLCSFSSTSYNNQIIIMFKLHYSNLMLTTQMHLNEPDKLFKSSCLLLPTLYVSA